MTRELLTKLPQGTGTQLQRWLPRLANLLLAIGIAWLCYQIALQFLPQGNITTAPVDTPATTTQIPEQAIPTSKIADWHLFGESAPRDTTDTSKQATTNAPETKLKLNLKGIVSTDDRTLGYAIIQKPDKEEKHFSVGDMVFGLASLEEIYVDRVILKRNDRYETLILPKDIIAGDLELEHRRKQQIKQVATNYRDIFMSRNGMELIKLFGFKPAYKNGGFNGFIVTAMGEQGREMMQTLGVEEGDMVTVVNGQRLSESLEAVESLKELKTATSIDVILERHGSEIPLHFDLDPPPDVAEDDSGSGSADEDLGENWGESEEDQQYMEKLKAQTKDRSGQHYELEYDH